MKIDQGRPLAEIMKAETEPQGNTMSKNKTGKRGIQAEEKRRRAVDLRRAGFTYEQIADKVGISRGYACKLVTSALKRIREETNEITEDVKALELQRLDELFRTAYQAVLDGEVRAIDQAIKVMDRRARLLGLDAATRQEISGTLTSSHEWIELRGVLIKTLSGYPEAQRAVLAAIAGGNGGTEK